MAPGVHVWCAVVPLGEPGRTAIRRTQQSSKARPMRRRGRGHKPEFKRPHGIPPHLLRSSSFVALVMLWAHRQNPCLWQDAPDHSSCLCVLWLPVPERCCASELQKVVVLVAVLKSGIRENGGMRYLNRL